MTDFQTEVQQARETGFQAGVLFTKENGYECAVAYINQQIGCEPLPMSAAMFGHWDGFQNGIIAAK